jgi:hypothetical protein
MSATMTTISLILKDVWSSKIYNAINNEAELSEIFEGVSEGWEGRLKHYIVQVSLNSGVKYISELGALPVAGQEGYVDLQLTTSELAATFELSTRVMKAAKSKNAGALIGALTSVMDGLKKSVANIVDLKRCFGHRFKGLLNEHKASSLTTGAFVGGGAALGGTDVWEAAIDFSPFQARGAANNANPNSDNFSGTVVGNTNTWVRVRLFQKDTYAEITPALAGGATQAAIFVSAFNLVTQTVSLTVVGDGVGCGFTTAAVGVGFAISLALHDVQIQDAALVNFGGLVPFSNEPRGIISNLCDPTHFTVDRTTATGGNASLLQSTVLTMANVAGVHARTAMVPARIQALLDQVFFKSTLVPDFAVLSPLARSVYAAALTTTPQYHNNGASTKADFLPETMTIGGYKPKTARHWPRGAMAFLTKESWELAEYMEAGFMDEDGEILSRVPGIAGYGGAYEVFDNLMCHGPNANAIICGFTV